VQADIQGLDERQQRNKKKANDENSAPGCSSGGTSDHLGRRGRDGQAKAAKVVVPEKGSN
jgi:hypothetical protein